MSNNSFFGRKKEAETLETAFNGLLKAYRLEGKFREKSLIHDWPELVGKTIADRTSSVFIRDQKLMVKITSGPVKKELMMNRGNLLKLIEEKYGAGVVIDLVCL